MKFSMAVLAALTLAAWTPGSGAAQAQAQAQAPVQAPASAPAQEHGIAYSDAELLAALESSYWIAASGPHPKKVYVLAAPWCGVCRELHTTVSQTSPDIEYRFILTAPRSQQDRVKIGHAAFLRTPAALGEVYGRGTAVQGPDTAAETYANGFNDALWTAIKPSLQTHSARQLGMPTLVFLSSGRLRVFPGMPSDLSVMSPIVDAMDAPSNSLSPTAHLLAAPPKLTPIDAKIAYARHDGTTLRVAPHTAATKLAQLKTGVGFMAKAVTEQDGERWYAFQFVADGPPAAFGKVSDFR